MTEEQHKKLERALEAMGHTHTLADIIDAIQLGHMQSFTEDDTWVVTQIIQTPRKRILEIVMLVGEMSEAEQLHDRVMNYAIENGCALVRTFARDGWRRKAREYGWKNGYSVFLMEV